MYVAVKGGAAAIEASWQLLAAERRGHPSLPELSVAQIESQMRLAVARVMAEGSLHDPQLAALALKQAQGDVMEAVFLLRAYRTTLPRIGTSVPLDTARIALTRRISAVFKDVPGGQLLGATYDYTQRLLDFSLLADGRELASAPEAAMAPEASRATAAPADAVAIASVPATSGVPRIQDLLRHEGLIEDRRTGDEAAASPEPTDITREPLLFPAERATRLQVLARADEGWLLALGYSTQRGYANGHPFAGEIRRGLVAVEVVADELGFALDIGDIELTECQMINQFTGSHDEPPRFTVGYGLAFGGAERKAIAMALVDRALRARELGEDLTAPAQDEEFVLMHGDSVESSGFVQHLKLPHHVDFQSELELVRRLRAEHAERGTS
jgi:alpha-D-ribose 1-methylphosphonate 5-triphosphate synthase subunit PhnI